MPRKEIHFFDSKYERGLPWYFDHFSNPPSEALITGEFTPNYLTNEQAMDRLATDTPHAKLLIMLRDPVERAWSAFNLMASHGFHKNQTFIEAMEQEQSLVNGGLYGKHCDRVFRLFPRDQVRIHFHEDVRNDPESVLRDVYEWLGVNSSFVPEAANRYVNLSAMPRLQKALRLPELQRRLATSRLAPVLRMVTQNALADRLRRAASGSRPGPAKIDHHEEMRAIFRDDIRRLQELLGRDLSAWM